MVCRDRRNDVLLLDAAGVDGREKLGISGRLKVHGLGRSNGGLRGRGVEVEHFVLGSEAGQEVEASEILVARVARLVDGHCVGDGSGHKASLLAVHVIVVTRAAQAGCRHHAGRRHGGADGAGEDWL